MPGLWRLEIANVLLHAERRKRLEAGGARRWVDMLRRLPIETDLASVIDPDLRVLDFAAENGLTTYDAAYLDVAIRTGLPLASKDTDLVKAARRRGVDLFPLMDT